MTLGQAEQQAEIAHELPEVSITLEKGLFKPR